MFDKNVNNAMYIKQLLVFVMLCIFFTFALQNSPRVYLY